MHDMGAGDGIGAMTSCSPCCYCNYSIHTNQSQRTFGIESFNERAHARDRGSLVNMAKYHLLVVPRCKKKLAMGIPDAEVFVACRES
jgi:hypothetical protein